MTPAATLEALAVPEVGQPWPDQGGVYAGIARDDDGTPPHHLILCSLPFVQMTWKKAMAWAKKLEHEGHADYSLPTRREAALLYATLYDQVETGDWYWTSTEYSERHAWVQYFDYGRQLTSDKSDEARARAVRRLPLGTSVLPSVGSTS